MHYSESNKPPPKDQYRIDEIEPISLDEPGKPRTPYEGLPEKQDLSLLAFFLGTVLEFLDKFKNWAYQKIAKPVVKLQIRQALKQLRDDFQILMQEDRSQEISFLNRLSSSWKIVLEQSLHIAASDPMIHRIQHFMWVLQMPGSASEKSVGYYLTEYQDGEWLPLPYMEILQRLHHAHKADPIGSLLTEWTSLIEEVLKEE